MAFVAADYDKFQDGMQSEEFAWELDACQRAGEFLNKAKLNKDGKRIKCHGFIFPIRTRGIFMFLRAQLFFEGN